MNMDQLIKEFPNMPPTLEELNEAITSYEVTLHDTDLWWHTLKDLFDRKLCLDELTDETIADLQRQPFWDKDAHYQTMLNECGDYYNRCHNILVDLTEYKTETFGAFCRCCGQVFAA